MSNTVHCIPASVCFLTAALNSREQSDTNVLVSSPGANMTPGTLPSRLSLFDAVVPPPSTLNSALKVSVAAVAKARTDDAIPRETVAEFEPETNSLASLRSAMSPSAHDRPALTSTERAGRGHARRTRAPGHMTK